MKFDLTYDTPLELQVKCEHHIFSLQSTIARIEEDFILIEKITMDGETITFTDKHTVSLLVNDGDVLYVWKNVKLSLEEHDGILYHKIQSPTSSKEIYDRRKNNRMHIGKNTPVFINTINGPQSINVFVSDLSQKGMAFTTKENLDIGKIIQLNITSGRPIINLTGTIVRKEHNSNSNSFFYASVFIRNNPDFLSHMAGKQSENIKQLSYQL